MKIIYVATKPVVKPLHLVKIGMTETPYERYTNTENPPGMGHDMNYEVVWETTAESRDELFNQEEEVHDHFRSRRMMRLIPGDSEWFDFKGEEPLEVVAAFVESRPWCKRRVPLEEITPTRRGRYLHRPYAKNLTFVKQDDTRKAILNEIHVPVIASIQAFMADPTRLAGTVIAPCGSGKTIMASKGIRGVQRCIITCPSRTIQGQWCKTLVALGVFAPSEIHLVGEAGTTDPAAIQAIAEGTFCLITTYASSHLLMNISAQLLLLDEAHHQAGKVATDGHGDGKTRQLMQQAVQRGMKRLSLTYTPRIIIEADDHHLTMDDEEAFGPTIASLKIRDMIEAGVLPDYRLWLLRDEAAKGTGMLGKAECILEAWEATEMVRGIQKHILHHLVVFAATIEDAKILETTLQKATDTLVLRAKQGDHVEDTIAQFTAAPRAILVNCFVLNEGVDIPAANAVAITYPKQARGQITQMVLRAGRWYEGKSVFHVLIPTLGDEDLTGFEEVLTALASQDDRIHDEILSITKKAASTDAESRASLPAVGEAPECIMIDEFEAKEEEIRKCFRAIRENLTSNSRRIQALCTRLGMDTSIEYARQRDVQPELPEDPRPKGVTWYAFLHPQDDPMRVEEFVKQIPSVAQVSLHYEAWRPSHLPSLQHINDGYFGPDLTNFDTIVGRFAERGHGRRR